MAGLLDGWGDFVRTPEGQGLLSAVFGGLAGARKGQPINSIGRAGLAGLSGYAVAQDQQAQMADRSAIQRYRDAQTSALTQKQQESARVQSAIANFGKQGMGMGATGMVNDALPPDLRIGAMPSIQPPATLYYTSLIQQGVPVETVKALAESRNFGLNKVARTQDVEGPGGAKVIQAYDDYGRPVGQGVNGYVAPVSVNQGDRTTFVKPAAGVSLPMNMTFADKNAAANLNLSRQRLAFDQAGGADATKPQWIESLGAFANPRTQQVLPARDAKGAIIEGAGPKLTEDQGKATGWLAQATQAYNNMKKVGVNEKGEVTEAARPGFNDALSAIPSFGFTTGMANMMRGDSRQQFMQSSSSLSEALLRAATGAGVNAAEAEQKVKELTPQVGDGDLLVKQKMEAIPMYLRSLEVRAGAGAKKLPQIMGEPSGSANYQSEAAAELARRNGRK